MMPHWVVLHMPQSWPQVPDKLRDQFLLNDEELAAEVELLAEHHVRDLFHDEGFSSACVNGAVSRLVIDVERFVDNRREPAAKRGFGAFYSKTEDGRPLRRELTREEYTHLARRHEMHHRQPHKNFAQYVMFWDRLMGTYQPYESGQIK